MVSFPQKVKTNKIIGFALLAGAAWLWFKGKKDAAKSAQPTNAFGAPLDAQKPGVFGANTSRLDPFGTRQATNTTANGGRASGDVGGNFDVGALFNSILGFAKEAILTNKKPTPATPGINPNAGIDLNAGQIAQIDFPANQGFDGFDFDPAIDDFGIDDIFAGEEQILQA